MFSFTALLSILIFIPSILLSADTTYVNPGTSISNLINSSSGGELFLLNSGNYHSINLTGRNFDSLNYVVIKNSGNGLVTVKHNSINTGHPLAIRESAYIVFEGIRFEGGLRAARIEKSSNLIFIDCEFTGSGQEGIDVIEDSRYIDFIGGRVYNTGNKAGVEKWGEGIYIGSASNKDIWPDYTRNVWVENMDIYTCGYGEAINIKGEVSRSTIRGNRIYDIQPGIDGQYNEGAISLEGTDDPASLNNRKENWVEDNHIFNIVGGGWPHGITFFGNGNVIKNNRIEYVTGTGIRGNTWKDQGLLTYVYNNNISNCGTLINIPTSMSVSYDDPGDNPNNLQSWYTPTGTPGIPYFPECNFENEPLAAWWALENSTADSSGNGHHSFLVNSASFQPTNSPREYALRAEQDGYADCGRVAFDACDPAMSITGWIKPAVSSPGERVIIAKTAGTAEQNYYWMTGLNSDRKLIFRLKTTKGGTQTLLSSGLVPIDEWTFIAATWDGDTMRIYINGEKDSQAPKGGLFSRNSTLRAFIGNGNEVSKPFNGLISNVKLFNIPLGPVTLYEDYTSNIGLYQEHTDDDPPDDDPPGDDPPGDDPPGDESPPVTITPRISDNNNDITIYSQPYSGILTIDNASHGNLMIYNLIGNSIQNTQISAGTRQIPIKIAKTGIYLVVVNTPAGITSRKILIII